ncbi:MAG: hypothetical protein BRC29_04165 [Nanohaloarchaea archaeon SW_7_43_1]|nr:MAG: hypothetical protein BRC29_04165 [Nanohaloarchaea archaeon SW_7_43_1]
MSSQNTGDSPEFGHIFEVYDHGSTGEAGIAPGIREKIEEGSIQSLEEVEEELGTDFLRPIMGDPHKTLKISAGSQGLPSTFVMAAADKFDDDWGWDVPKTEERVFVTPQSHLHDEFMQRRQQAEQRVKQAMQGIEQLRKNKHLLQHDIRKLRGKVESLRSGEETTIKGDFIELVDSAGGGQQGSAPGSLDFLRNNNIYPSIVADFQEMDSLNDLLSAEKKAEKHGGEPSEYQAGPLSKLPENEKAILKKKYAMYEKWKDLYGSEIERKLDDLKKELRRVETGLEEQKKQTAPYVRDMVMINQKTNEELAEDMNRYFQFQGDSTTFKHIEFIPHKPFKKEHGELTECEEGEATHYKILYIHGVHVNMAIGENPQSPAEGPTAGQVAYFPALVDKFTFENIFKEKIERQKNRFENLMENYTGNFKTGKGDEFQKKREQKELSIRKLREKVGKKVSEKRGEEIEPPLQFSSSIRRMEDGFDHPNKIQNEYGEDYMEAINEILDTSYGKEKDRTEGLSGFQKKVKLFTGQEDQYYLSDDYQNKIIGDLAYRFKFTYYFDLKISMGLYTMK